MTTATSGTPTTPVEVFDDERAWLARRREGITASDAAVILGVNPFEKPLELFARKLGLLPEIERTEAIEWGLLLEEPIARRYQIVTRRRVARPIERENIWVLHRHPDLPHLMATIDRDVVEGPEPMAVPAAPAAGVGVLEIKTTSAFGREYWQDEPPVYYQVQVQHQLLVTGRQWGSIAVLIGGQLFLWFDIPRNDEFIAVLLEQELAFWERLRHHDPPPPDATQGARDALKAIYPREERDTIALPASLLDWDDQRQQAVQLIATATAAKTEAEAHLQAAIGDHAWGLLPNGVGYSWRTVHRRGYTVAPTSSRQLRRHEKAR